MLYTLLHIPALRLGQESSETTEIGRPTWTIAGWRGFPHVEKMALSQCLTRGSSVTCTTCWGDEVAGTVVAAGDGASVAVLSKSEPQRTIL